MGRNREHREKLIAKIHTQWVGMILGVIGLGAVATLTYLSLTNANAIYAMALQSSGKVVLAGNFQTGNLLRLNTDGQVDSSFTNTWTLGDFNEAVLALAVQPDDKIVAGGNFTNFDDSIVGHIVRLNSNGSLDTDFVRNIGTGFDSSVSAVSVQGDGKIIVGGQFTSFNGTAVKYLARLNSDGTLDSNFNPSPHINAPVYSVYVQGTDTILIGGESGALSRGGQMAKIQSNGSVDGGFILRR